MADTTLFLESDLSPAQAAKAEEWFQAGKEDGIARRAQSPHVPVDDHVLELYTPQKYYNQGWLAGMEGRTDAEVELIKNPYIALDPQIGEFVRKIQILSQEDLKKQIPGIVEFLTETRKPTPEQLKRWNDWKDQSNTIQIVQGLVRAGEAIATAIYPPVGLALTAAFELTMKYQKTDGKNLDDIKKEIDSAVPPWDRKVTSQDALVYIKSIYRYRGFVSIGVGGPFGFRGGQPADLIQSIDWQSNVDKFQKQVDDSLALLGGLVGQVVTPYFPISKLTLQIPPEERIMEATGGEPMEPLYFWPSFARYVATEVGNAKKESA